MNIKTWNWRAWLVQYVLPAIILLGAMGIMGLFSDDPDVVWVFVVAPIISFLTAFVVLPEHVWVTPMAVGLVLGSVLVVGALLDLLEPNAAVPIAFLLQTLTVALPLTVSTWFGMAFGHVFRGWRDDRRWRNEWRDHGPQAPAH